MEYLYTLHHVYPISDSMEEVKFIGWFATKLAAQRCIKTYQQLPGFKERPNDFILAKEEVDKIYWKSGFTPSKHAQIKRLKDQKDH